MRVCRVSPTADQRPAASLAVLAMLVLLRNGSSAGQQSPPPPADGTASSTPSKTKKVADLTPRYRFSERYTTDNQRIGPGVVGSYRVAVREVTRTSVESAQGAPRRTESSLQAIYAERPTEMGDGVGVVASSARVYEKYLAKPEDDPGLSGGRPIEGLKLLVRPRLVEPPLILCLSENRAISEGEYEALCRQVYVPHLAMALPTATVRLGDTWRVSRRGEQTLLGDISIQAETLVGKLVEVRKEVDGPRMVASIAITGKVAVPGEETTVNAEILFTFQDTTAPRDPTRRSTSLPSPTEDQVEARGAVTELRLAAITSGPMPGPGRLRFQSNRELTLHRQLGPVAGGAEPPALEREPEVTEANAWLLHADPAGHYSFRHPQDFLPPGRGQPAAEPNSTLLLRTRRDGRDVLQLKYFDKVLTPEDLKKELAERYKALKMEVVKGEEVWLPVADWAGLRVHRIDAAVKRADPKAARTAGSARIHFDGYLIQFARSSSLLAVASTSKEAVTPFREEVEKVLRTIQLDPARPFPIDKAPLPPGAARPGPG